MNQIEEPSYIERYCEVRCKSLEDIRDTCRRHIKNTQLQLLGCIDAEDLTETDAFYLEMCRLHDARDAKDWNLQLSEKEVQELKKVYRTFKYEYNNYVTQEDIKAKRYKKKRVLYLFTKPRGETSYGRGGNLYY